MERPILIYTDGSARGNPGPGGWAVLVLIPDATKNDIEHTKVIELAGREEHTTNNRMELTAALQALETLRIRKIHGKVIVYTDSTYLLQGISGWVYAWEKNNWKTKNNEDVANQDLWKELLAITYRQKMSGGRDIVWEKVAGHAGIFGNERVDLLATKLADNEQTILFTGNLKTYQQLYGPLGSSASKRKNKGDAYSYVSFIDGKIAVYPTWQLCEKSVKGKPGAKFKKALSAEDERAIISSFEDK